MAQIIFDGQNIGGSRNNMNDFCWKNLELSKNICVYIYILKKKKKVSLYMIMILNKLERKLSHR